MSTWIGIAAFALLGVSVFLAIRSNRSGDREYILISRKAIVFFICIAVIWTFLGGIGGHYYQSPDWDWRNAIFHDLIYKKWPVIYSEYDKALVYYIGYWLPSAALTKAIAFAFPGILQTETAFTIGNQFLWLWTLIGIMLVYFLVMLYAKPATKRKMCLIPCVLAIFSGLDIVGAVQRIITKHTLVFSNLHIEWWMSTMQFSSLTTCLFWVFNQCVIPWVVTCYLLQEKKVGSYVLLGVCALLSGPLPFLGIAVYMFANAVIIGIKKIKEKEWVSFAKDIFSVGNLLALPLVVLVYFYYSTNGAVNAGADMAGISLFGIVNVILPDAKYLLQVYMFLFWEAGIYFLLLWDYYRRDPLFYITLGSLCIAPFFYVGTASDFVMRFSIPGILMLSVMCIKVICSDKWRIDAAGILLCVVLALGAVTPATEVMRGYSTMLTTGKVANVQESIGTLDQDFIKAGRNDMNFVTYEYKDKLFFKYMAH